MEIMVSAILGAFFFAFHKPRPMLVDTISGKVTTGEEEALDIEIDILFVWPINPCSLGSCGHAFEPLSGRCLFAP